jgi:DNA-binding ferritin-like protein (Dps family)
VGELEGPYRQAMKEVSVRLMDALPAGDDLWQMLGQVEAMLLEAQMRGMPLSELFGNGGTAAFCQSIVDEYKADGEATVPAAQDRSLKSRGKKREPRGGIGYHRKRRMTAWLTAILVLLFLGFATWHTGILRFLFVGTSYYLEELHNFQSNVVLTESEPITLMLPLERVSGMANTVYADGEGYDITVTAVEPNNYTKNYTDPDTGETVHRKMTRWYLRMTYTVKSGFTEISYVEPPSAGTVTVTMADGTVYHGELTWIESGADGRGREFARISLIELPAVTDTRGATVTVVFDPPNRVTWNRVSMGKR